MGSVAFIEEKGKLNLGLGIPAGAATILAAGRFVIINMKTFLSFVNSIEKKTLTAAKFPSVWVNTYCTFVDRITVANYIPNSLRTCSTPARSYYKSNINVYANKITFA